MYGVSKCKGTRHSPYKIVKSFTEKGLQLRHPLKRDSGMYPKFIIRAFPDADSC